MTVLLGGVGMTSVLNSNQVSSAETERQSELSRAMEFINAEIRQAQSVRVIPADDLPQQFWDSLNGSEINPSRSAIRPILQLEFSSQPNLPVVYYIAEPSGNGLWRGQQLVLRWGPDFDAEGDYGATPMPLNDWKHRVLVDSLDGGQLTEVPPTCPEGWNRSPAGDQAIASVGFYACIAPSARMANLFQLGQINKPLSRNASIRLKSQSYSRSNTMWASPPPSDPPDPPCPAPSSGVFQFTPQGPCITQTSTITVKFMGGAITCGPGGPTIGTASQIVLLKPNQTSETVAISNQLNQPITLNNVPAGTRVKLVGERLPLAGSNCGTSFQVNSLDQQGSQVLTLANGSSVPQIEPFDGQTPIEDFVAGILDLQTQQITIEDQQLVFLFEVGTTNPQSSAYDFQDIIVLADIQPVVSSN